MSRFEGRQVVVTGAAGFVGSHVVGALLAEGAAVRCLDNFVTGSERNLEPYASRVEIVRGDIRDRVACEGICAGADVVLHQAALGSVPRSLEHPAETIEVNVTGFANVLDAARRAGIRRVVYASSSSVYGDAEQLPKVEGAEGRPLSPYALSKQMNEELAAVFSDAYDLQPIGLRYFNVYGPRQDPNGPYAAVIPRFIAAGLAGQAPSIDGDGGQTRDFTFVADTVEANLLAALAPAAASRRVYNIAAGRGTSVLELAETVRDSIGDAPPPTFGPPRPGDVRDSVADPSLARQWLGFEARTTLAEGLGQTLAFYRDVALASADSSRSATTSGA